MLFCFTQPSVPAFKVSQDETSVVLATAEMRAVFDRRDESLHFTDSSGKTFLSEIAGTRRLDPATVQGEATFAAEQAFHLPAWRTPVRKLANFRTASSIFETFPGA